MRRSTAAVLALALAIGCGDDPPPAGPDSSPDAPSDPDEALLQSEIELPAGFEITIFAKDVLRPRFMELGDDGTVYVGTYFFTRGVTSAVYALRDTDGDGRADFRRDIRNGFNSPNGLAYADGTLWIVDEDRVWRLDDIDNTLDAPLPRVIFDGLPSRAQTDSATNVGHFWRQMTMGPDGRLYIAVGTRWSFLVGEHTANDLNDDPIYSTIVRLNPDGSGLEIFADGVRNSMGMDFRPGTGELWFTDNGPSWPFEHPNTYDIPPDELNRATAAGQHFGFPYIHGRLPDPLIGGDTPAGVIAPAHEFAAHSATLGIAFYTGQSFPARYRGGAFIAEHGTEATTPVFGVKSRIHGDRISFVTIDGAGAVTGYEVFAGGFLRNMNFDYARRPVGLLVLPDGSLLISDDQAHMIYRVSYVE
ncbi:MAG: PQQ-dependent sugar dehydrogenase [Gemmatimonadota bacterium]